MPERVLEHVRYFIVGDLVCFVAPSLGCCTAGPVSWLMHAALSAVLRADDCTFLDLSSPFARA